MHINSMSRIFVKNIFVLESSIWIYKYCGFLALATLHGALQSDMKAKIFFVLPKVAPKAKHEHQGHPKGAKGAPEGAQ